MDRRGFLIHTARAGSVLLILPAGWAVSGCDNDQNAVPAVNQGVVSFRFTSDITLNHTHDFTIVATDLNTPQTSGLNAPTTMTLGHFHTVILSPVDLMQISSGGTIIRTTSIVEGHAHDFTFSFATAEGQSTTPPMTVSPVGPGTVISTGTGSNPT
jgi:hypothetical protein